MVGILFVGMIAYQSLPVAPLPKVDFPTIQVSAQLPGASAETMASSVAQPLERQFAQIPGRVADDVVERPRQHHRGGAVRPRPQHRRGRQRHPGRHQCRQRPAAARSAGAADLPQGQPGGLADPAAVGDLRRHAADRRRRQRRHQARPADQPDLGRRPGQHRRRAEAGHPHPARSGQAGGQEHLAGRRAHRSWRSRPSTRPRAASTARCAATPSTPTTS